MWCLVPVAEALDCLAEPTALISGGEERAQANSWDGRFGRVLRKILALRKLGLRSEMVVESFLKMRIAPLQDRSHFAWDFTGENDPTRLFPGSAHTPSDTEVGRLLRILCAPNDEWCLP